MSGACLSSPCPEPTASQPTPDLLFPSRSPHLLGAVLAGASDGVCGRAGRSATDTTWSGTFDVAGGPELALLQGLPGKGRCVRRSGLSFLKKLLVSGHEAVFQVL